MADLESLPMGEDAPGVVNAVIEVPVGSRNKYEYDPDLGVIIRDRVLPGSVRYPSDYGFIPSTRADDGDPLDVVLAAHEPSFPGCVVRARPVGLLNMSDEEGEDHKILAVPDDDPRFEDIQKLDDLPAQNLQEIEQFFTVYKQLEGDKHVEVRGWHGPDDAREMIECCAL